MPSIVENQMRWTEHSWDRQGHEWSPGGSAAGGDLFWWRGLLPRIHRHLPASRVLELGPGFGRWTSHFVRQTDELSLVDVTERCIDYCRERFAQHSHVKYWTNDGESLAMIPEGSIDFVFSFDSLVHAEASVLRSYILQIAEKLRPGGTGFIHHSNLHGLTSGRGTVPAWVRRKNWRGETMSAQRFREYCAEAGLECVSQELVNWVSRSRRADRHRITGRGMPLTDAFSTFRRPLSPTSMPAKTRVYANAAFAEEWRQCIDLAAIYGSKTSPSQVSADRAMARPPLITRVKEKLAREADYVTSLVKDRYGAWETKRREPIINALRQRRCPDCHGSLEQYGCGRCRIVFQGLAIDVYA